MMVTLKEARINARYKAKDVAAILGVPAPKITQFEKGERPIKEEHLKAMLRLYRVARKNVQIRQKTVFYAE